MLLLYLVLNFRTNCGTLILENFIFSKCWLNVIKSFVSLRNSQKRNLILAPNGCTRRAFTVWSKYNKRPLRTLQIFANSSTEGYVFLKPVLQRLKPTRLEFVNVNGRNRVLTPTVLETLCRFTQQIKELVWGFQNSFMNNSNIYIAFCKFIKLFLESDNRQHCIIYYTSLDMNAVFPMSHFFNDKRVNRYELTYKQYHFDKPYWKTLHYDSRNTLTLRDCVDCRLPHFRLF